MPPPRLSSTSDPRRSSRTNVRPPLPHSIRYHPADRKARPTDTAVCPSSRYGALDCFQPRWSNKGLRRNNRSVQRADGSTLSSPLPPTIVLPLAIRDGFYVNGQTFDSAAYIETMELTPEYDVLYPVRLFLLSLFFTCDFESYCISTDSWVTTKLVIEL